jgi:uncharacterized protein (DUF433 family)
MESESVGGAGVSSAGAEVMPASWIEKTPGVCGGDACIRWTRIPVWGLMEWRNLGLSDAEILDRSMGLTQADLDAAWEYYAKHREEIDEAIRDNDAAMEEENEA